MEQHRRKNQNGKIELFAMSHTKKAKYESRARVRVSIRGNVRELI